MAVAFKDTGGGRTAASGINLPVLRGLRVVSRGGGSLAFARQNAAAADLAPAILSPVLPTIAAQYTRISEVSHFSFPITEPQSATIFHIFRAVETDLSAGGRPGQVGWNIPNSGGSGFGIVVGSGTILRAAAKFGSTVQFASITTYSAGDLNIPRLLVAKVEAGVGVTLKDLTANLSIFTADTNTRALNSLNGPFKIGGYRNLSTDVPGNLGAKDEYYTVLHDVALTDDEITTQAVPIRKWALEMCGITV